jgi:GT2 family glycosyltransferase/glycosyltransferase involved in cell wall biosynthesis
MDATRESKLGLKAQESQALTIGRFHEVKASEVSPTVLARISFDLMVAAPGVGLFLWGWSLPAASELVSVVLTGPGIGSVELLDADYEPISRSDVAGAFRSAEELKPADENCGFAAFVPQREEGSLDELLVECRTSDGTQVSFYLAEVPAGEAAAGAFLRQAARFVFGRLDPDSLERLGRLWHPVVAGLVETWQSAGEEQLSVDHCTVLGGHWLLLMGSRPSPQLLASAKRFIVSSASGRFAALRWQVSGEWFIGVAEGVVAQGGDELYLIPVGEKGMRRPFRVEVERSLALPVFEARRLVEELFPPPSQPSVRVESRLPARAGAELRSQLHGLLGRTVHGWAAEPGSDAVASIDVLLDDTVVGTTLSNRRERSLGPDFGGRDHGFEWVLPRSAFDGATHRVRLTAGAERPTLAELTTGPGQFDARVEDFRGGIVYGWVLERVDPFAPARINVLIDDVELGEFECKERLAGELAIQLGHSCGFEIPVPIRFLDGRPHWFRAYVGKERVLRVELRAEVRGAVDRLNLQHITGWVAEFGPAGPRSVDIDLYIEGEKLDLAVARIHRPDIGAECGIQYDTSRFTGGLHSFELCLKLKGTDIAVAKTPLYYVRQDDEIRLLQGALSSLRSKPTLDREERWLRGLLPQLIAESRVRTVDHRVLHDATYADETAERVIVVIPVYGGFHQTRACIQSVLDSRTRNRTPHELLLVDDCGPDARIGPLLRSFATQAGVTLVPNERNLGFVKSVNRGLQRAVGHDVVLLNADTVVNGDWLDRLRAAASKRPMVASVTPFSNNATICSYPDFCKENELPHDTTLEELDEICKSVNSGDSIEIPTAVGFCMYMRAGAVAQVGVLDEKWGRGYGEENDWCLRARDLGWIHVLAADVFVEHEGNVSFGEEVKNAQLDQNLRALSVQYPEYEGDIQRFVLRDPIRTARNRVTVERLRRRLVKDRMKPVLFVTHGLGGGIKVHCDSMAKELLRDGVAAVQLGSEEDTWELSFYGLTATYESSEFAELERALTQLAPGFVHVHSDIGFDEPIWRLPKTLGCDLYFTVHDYLPICPRVNMMNAAHVYCGGPTDTAVCNVCIGSNGAYPLLVDRFEALGSDAARWREHYADLLGRARAVFVPDPDVKERLARFFPKLVTRVLPHPSRTGVPKVRLPLVPAKEPLRIAVIGAIGQHKGFELLLRCANDAALRQLPLGFHVFGHTCDDHNLAKNPTVQLSGRYLPEELPELLERSHCQVALFLSRWPETYSYTLTEALECGLYPVALDIGAPARRLRELGVGKVLPIEASAAEINDALVALGPLAPRELVLKEGRYESVLEDYYGLPKARSPG